MLSLYSCVCHYLKLRASEAQKLGAIDLSSQNDQPLYILFDVGQIQGNYKTTKILISSCSQSVHALVLNETTTRIIHSDVRCRM